MDRGRLCRQAIVGGKKQAGGSGHPIPAIKGRQAIGCAWLLAVGSPL